MCNSDYFWHNKEMKKLSVSKLIGFSVGCVPSIPKGLRQVTQIMIRHTAPKESASQIAVYG